MATVGQKYGITGSQGEGWTFTGTIAAGSGSSTGVWGLANGTAAAPAIGFTSDPDTGLFRTSANVLGVAAGGSSVGTFSSAGFTGAVNGTVGATTAAAGLFTTIGASGVTTIAVGAVGTPSLIFSGDTNTGLYWIGADSFGMAANGVVQATITTGGINGIVGGTTAAAGTFTTLTAADTTTTGTVNRTPQIATAAGSNSQTDSTAITKSVVVVTTVSATTRGVRLPAAGTGREYRIHNAGGTNVNVYPATNDAIGSGATNAASVLTKGKASIYFAQDAVTWVVMAGA